MVFSDNYKGLRNLRILFQLRQKPSVQYQDAVYDSAALYYRGRPWDFSFVDALNLEQVPLYQADSGSRLICAESDDNLRSRLLRAESDSSLRRRLDQICTEFRYYRDSSAERNMDDEDEGMTSPDIREYETLQNNNFSPPVTTSLSSNYRSLEEQVTNLQRQSNSLSSNVQRLRDLVDSQTTNVKQQVRDDDLESVRVNVENIRRIVEDVKRDVSDLSGQSDTRMGGIEEKVMEIKQQMDGLKESIQKEENINAE